MNNEHSEAVRQVAPHGRLRAAINLGNPVLAQRGANGTPIGISVELARELADRLGLPLDVVVFDAAGKVFDALRSDAWDVAFMAIDPQRAQQIDFTPPYVIIEGGYMVASSSSCRHVDEVDRSGVRVAVARGSAYDLFLSRALHDAHIVRCGTGGEAFEQFRRDGLEALAGVKAALARLADQHTDVRLLTGSFMVIEQAMGIAKGRSAGVAYLRDFIEAMKATGFVAAALHRSGQHDARVAPAAGDIRRG